MAYGLKPGVAPQLLNMRPITRHALFRKSVQPANTAAYTEPLIHLLRDLKIITYPNHCEKGEYPQTIFPNPIGAQSVFQ